eukprot:1048233_1
MMSCNQSYNLTAIGRELKIGEFLENGMKYPTRSMKLHRKVKEEIKKRQPKDIKETYLMKQMDLVTDKMYLALKRLDKDIEAIEKNKKRIKAKYKQLVNDLGLLSRYRCNECGINGYDNVRDNRTTCDTCKKEMC